MVRVDTPNKCAQYGMSFDGTSSHFVNKQNDIKLIVGFLPISIIKTKIIVPALRFSCFAVSKNRTFRG